jgi:acetoacetyl-CoA synthetase
VVLTRDDYAASLASLPHEIAAMLTRRWPAEALIRPLAELLLHADLRPDDRVLVVGAAWPWLAALLEGTTVILAAPGDLLAAAEQECATVLVAAPRRLSEAAFQRPGRRAALGRLRTVIATGGPLSPEERRRIYAWLKADVMLLARTGDTFWGNPLEPVLAQPPAAPAFLTPPASVPATR